MRSYTMCTDVICKATEVYNDGFRYSFGYFPTREEAQKKFDEDGSHATLEFEDVCLPVKVSEIDFVHCEWLDTNDGFDTDLLCPMGIGNKDVFSNANVIAYEYDNSSILPHHRFIIDLTGAEAKQMAADYKEKRREAKREAAREYLASPFAKGWLKKMQYTERVDEYGHKFLFIAIKCGYNKISDEAFQRLCNAICEATYGDKLRMTMWIGGKVNWTMFYQRPDHVNGHETYFCGVVGEDDFSPEDWDKDHSAFSFKNADKY